MKTVLKIFYHRYSSTPSDIDFFFIDDVADLYDDAVDVIVIAVDADDVNGVADVLMSMLQPRLSSSV